MKHRLALITGSTGFIGSRLARGLASHGWDLRLARRATSRADRLGELQCQSVQLDISQADPSALQRALEDVSHVFHVAGLVCGTPDQLQRVNHQGTASLVRAAANLDNPPKVILISSAAAGGPAAHPPRRPEDPPQPVSLYGKSKLAGEMAAIEHRRRCPLTIVRPGVVFGEGDQEFIRIFRAMTKTRVNPLVAGGLQPLSMIEVDDLVDLIIRAAERGKSVQTDQNGARPVDGIGIYNAADPHPLSLRDLGNIVRQELPGHRFLDMRLPPIAAFCVGAASEFGARLVGKSTTLNRDKIREARAVGWAMEVSKSLEELEWKPRQSIKAHLIQLLHNGLANGQL